jgi:general secretion pathway protein G
MKRPSRTRRAARAFTIAEIIVVVVIIGILATIVATRLLPKIGGAKTTTALANANTLAGAVQEYWSDCGEPPSGVALIDFLMTQPANVGEGKWKGPYMQNRDQFVDPWGNPFVLVIPPQFNSDFDVMSYGSDGQPGGTGEAADITNGKRK